uniref:Uncharacterized protein n=1 Tax=Ditylenchus dipsaci TaxID=166011 RepID=A0A915EQ76_9BILA
MFFFWEQEDLNAILKHKYQITVLLYAIFEASLFSAVASSNEDLAGMLFLIFPFQLFLGVILQKECFFTFYMAYNRLISMCYFMICFVSFFLAVTMPCPYIDFMRDNAHSWSISLKTDHDIFVFTMALHIITGLQGIFLLLVHFFVERASGEITKKLSSSWDEHSDVDSDDLWEKHPYIYDC